MKKEQTKEEKIKNEVLKIIASTLEVEQSELSEKTNLLADLDVESLDLVDLVVAFEDKYNIEIPDQDVKDLQTVGDVINYLQKHV